jgi:hypothetical protein
MKNKNHSNAQFARWAFQEKLVFMAILNQSIQPSKN